MRKMFLFVLAAAALLLMVPAQNAQAQGQSETPKVEVGAHYTLLRFRDFSITDSGVGGRVTYNLSDNIGIEGELNFFPQKRSTSLTAFPLFVDSTRTQGLFGVKTGLRSEKAGFLNCIPRGRSRCDLTWAIRSSASAVTLLVVAHFTRTICK